MSAKSASRIATEMILYHLIMKYLIMFIENSLSELDLIRIQMAQAYLVVQAHLLKAKKGKGIRVTNGLTSKKTVIFEFLLALF